ncbi:MAG: hypothetical protein OHK0045_07380 [Raineya sp.]
MKRYILTTIFFISYSLQAQYSWEQLREQAIAAYKAGNYTDATKTYEQALQKAAIEFGKQDERYTQTAYAVAFVYCKVQNYQRAEELYTECKNIAEQKKGKMSREYALMCNKLAIEVYHAQKQYQKAEPLLAEVKDIEEKIVGKEHPEYAMAVFSLAVLMYEQNKLQEAEPLLLTAKNTLEKAYGKKHPDRLLACQYLIALYQKQNRTALAELLSKELKEDLK